jgi:hypothetical protein
VAPAATAAPHQVVRAQPDAPLTHPERVVADAPWDDTDVTAPVVDEGSNPIPDVVDVPPQITGRSEKQRGYWWGLGGTVVAGLAVLALITVLVAHQIGHRHAANATQALAAGRTPTDGTSTSGAVSSSAAAPRSTPASRSASTSGPTRAANHRRGLAQASMIDRYLTASGQARHRIGAAINAISRCTNIPSAVTRLQSAARVRSRIVTTLASADVTALPGGAAAVADLRRAMRASANADRQYAAWGRAVAGCHGHAHGNAQFAAAQRSDAVATAAKGRFADEWNPIAARYGLAKQNANTI